LVTAFEDGWAAAAELIMHSGCDAEATPGINGARTQPRAGRTDCTANATLLLHIITLIKEPVPAVSAG
jgi:hypothetical protein